MENGSIMLPGVSLYGAGYIFDLFYTKICCMSTAPLKVYSVSTFAMHPNTASKDTEVFCCCDY